MRKFLLAGLCVFVNAFGLLFAQNKTLGVGVLSPNPNAALHVESPTGNQGFLMPRLTTAQRDAMSAILTDADKGLMLYDTDLYSIFIWEGTAWGSTSQFSVDDPASTADAINVLNLGLGVAGRFKTDNVASQMPTVWAETNSNAPLSAPIYGLNTGTGDVAGSFRINNAGNGFPALFAESNGTGRVATFLKTGTGNQPTVFANVKTTGHGFWAEHEGTTGYAAILQSVNAANPDPAVFVEALGAGFSLFVQKSQPTSTGEVIFSEHLGTAGSAGRFVINNAASTSPGIATTTNGSGPAITAENTGTTDGFAGVFTNTISSNNFPAMQASTAGNGSGVRVMQSAGNGPGMDVFMQNATSVAPGMSVDQGGLGNAATFVTSNASNSTPAVHAVTSGTGAALEATTSTGFTALYGRREGASNGNAGLFDIIDASNTYPALQANTAGTGSAGYFKSTNSGATAPSLQGETNSNGGAVKGLSTGPGYAGWFQISNAASSSIALRASHDGTGTALQAEHTGASGNIAVFQSGGANVARIDKNGQGLFNGGTASSGADVAEMFDVEGERNSYEPGDVLVISEDSDRTVEKSSTANSTRVAGVYATKPGVKLTERNLEEDMDDLVPMGVIGVIPTKVCLENGPIKRGDLLVTSSRQGHAMKAIPATVNGVLIYPTGAILGKALENFDQAKPGLIKVLVNVK